MDPRPFHTVSRVVVTWTPQAGEREVVEENLGDDAEWATDGADACKAEGLLMFWPRQELRALGLEWNELAAGWVKLATAGANHVGWHPGPPMPVLTTPGATAPAIAEYILANILSWTRGLTAHTRSIRGGHFEQGAPIRGLSELRIGLVGYGGIGQETARILHLLGATVEAVSRSGKTTSEARKNISHLATIQELPAMAGRVDVLVLCLPLHKDTVGLVDAALLEAFADGLLVNVSRGPVVDEDALYTWLHTDKTRRAAALDVWWRYPRGIGWPFRRPFDQLPNITMTPHNSPNIAGFRLGMLEAACKDIRALLDGGDLAHVADPEAHRLEIEGDGR